MLEETKEFKLYLSFNIDYIDKYFMKKNVIFKKNKCQLYATKFIENMLVSSLCNIVVEYCQYELANVDLKKTKYGHEKYNIDLGYFLFGKRQGRWICSYNPNNFAFPEILSIGNYKEDVKKGSWVQYAIGCDPYKSYRFIDCEEDLMFEKLKGNLKLG